MPPYDYNQMFSTWQAPSAGSWMPRSAPVNFGYTPSAFSADYSLGTPAMSGSGLNFGDSPTSALKLGGSMPDTGTGSAIANYLREIGFLGTRDQQGWGGLALGAAQGLGGLYMGMQQYNLAKEALANSKAQFERNFAAQAQTLNTQMADRQAARVASNPGAYESVSSYMDRNRVV